MTEEESVRLDRLHRLREQGINPFPSTVKRTFTLQGVLDQFETLESSQAVVSVVGRVRLIRKHGGITFIQLQDGSGLMQAALKVDEVGEERYEQFHAFVDMGDFIQVEGSVFLTKKGERTIDSKSFQFVCKALLPLPEKWHGLSDTEMRFRKRYLDIIINDEVRNRLKARSAVIAAMRELLESKGFMEVETPTLQPVYGGGFARPFKTKHNALDAEFYLRISDEMYLKRLLVGGFEKVYEITKVFRNEGIDRDHNPEFTMFEAQIAYENYEYGMDLFEEIFEFAAQKANGTTQTFVDNVAIELARPWKRMRLIDAVKEIGGIEPEVWDDLKTAKDVLSTRISKQHTETIARIQKPGELMALAFEELVEEQLIQPTIIFDYPIEVSPLAKKSADPRFVERFEVFAMGSEIGNNYSELNDPEDLEKRFIEEKEREQAGFDEAHQTDTDYLEAIKHGMPPACGLGIGVDRMVMLITGASNIKEVIAFPTLRPQSSTTHES